MNNESTGEQKKLRSTRTKLIFNPGAGATNESHADILDVVREMQAWNIVPEAFLVEEGSDLPAAVRDALSQGISLFVVCGGDGTISTVAETLVGTDATLGIIPNGTQNNIALSLGIPPNLPDAIAILRTGSRIKLDVGLATVRGAAPTRDEIVKPFLEVCSVGLGSALFPSADDIQHGNLSRIGDFLSTLVTSPPADIHMVLDDKQEVRAPGHMVLVSNMRYIGRHYEVGSATAHSDGFLDVMFFADLSKLDLLGYAIKGVSDDDSEDPRLQRYRVRSVEINAQPAMQVMIDGNIYGEGQVRLEVRQRHLAVMTGNSLSTTLSDPDEKSGE